jgi:hypothetical protein
VLCEQLDTLLESTPHSTVSYHFPHDGFAGKAQAQAASATTAAELNFEGSTFTFSFCWSYSHHLDALLLIVALFFSSLPITSTPFIPFAAVAV